MDRVRRAVTMKSNSKPIPGIEGNGIRKAVTIQVTRPNEPGPLANKSGGSPNKNTPSPNLTVPTILDDGYIDKEKLKDLLNTTFGKGQWKAKNANHKWQIKASRELNDAEIESVYTTSTAGTPESK